MPKPQSQRSREYRERHPERVRAAQKRWRDANKDYNIERQRPYHLMTKYGITEADYERMLKEQGGRCAICDTDTPTGKWKVFAVDHCHHTGVVRGLLCNECNRGMGLLRDDPDLLRKAADYLKITAEAKK